jgi:hypothetical protein
MAKLYPIIRDFNVGIETGPAPIVGRVNVDASLSQLNRRLYRQGRCYTVKVDLQSGLADNTQYTVYALANTWMLKKAWQAAFENYLNQTKEERATFKGKLARWNDFRLSMASAFTGAGGMKAGLVDPTGGEDAVVGGESVVSQIVDDAGTTRYYGIGGSAGGTTFDILDEFVKLGAAQAEPSSTETSVAYGATDTDLQDGEIDEVTDNGNLPPYAVNGSHVATPWRKVGVLHSDTGGQRLSTGYFDAPLGIVIITRNDGSNHKLFSQGTELSVEVKAGDYKGVHSTPMFDRISVKPDRIEVR